MDQTILSGVFVLIGVVLGWILNMCSESKMKKPKLCYQFQITSDQTDLIPYENRTKTSESGFAIEIYNIGQVPVFINYVRLYYKKKIIVDCFMLNRQLMPYEKEVYELTMQDYRALGHYCKEKELKRCKVVAFDVEGKKIKGNMELWGGLWYPFDGN